MTSQPRHGDEKLPPDDLQSRAGGNFLKLLDAVPDAMMITNRSGIIVAANPCAEDLFGYARAELSHKPLMFLIPERFRPKHQHHEASFFVNPHARPMGKGRDLVGLRKDGTEIPLEISLSPFLLEGQVAGCVVLCVDITERKHAEEALQRSEERYRTLVEISPDAIYVNHGGTIVFANAAALRLLGASEPSQILGKPALEIIPPENRLLVRDRIRLSLQGQTVPALEEKFVRLDGSLVDVEVIGTPVDWQGSRAIQVVARDISERKRVEVALRESENRYRSLFENMREGFAYCQMLSEGDAPNDFVYLHVNPAFEELTGLKNVIGRKVSEVIPGIRESNPELFKAYGRVALSGTPERFETYVEPLAIWFSISVYSLRKGYFFVTFDNITQRKLSEEALRRSEGRYRLLFESNPQPMWVYHLATLRFLAVNQAAVDHYGYSRQEFLALTLRDIRPPEDIPALEKSVFDAASPIDRAGVWRHRTKYGRIIYVEITEGHVVFEGKASGLILANDVTERVQAEEKLRLHAAALESAANAIVITDPGGNIQWVNPAFERFTGYSSNEAIGQNPRLLQSGEHDKAFYKQMWDAILAGRVWEGDLTNRRKDGSIYNEHQTITPVRDANGVITNFVGIKEDITDRKRAEEALRRSESDYRSIIEGAPYGIYRVSEDARILMANPALAKVLGYASPAELIGLNTATDLYLSPEDRERSVARWRGTEAVQPYEVTWKRKDGKHINVRLAGRMLHEHGEMVPSYEVFVEDITEQRSLEAQFRQAQKMEAVGLLAGGVAHDFNNLLMIISSYAQLIPEHLTNSAKIEKDAKEIRDAASRAAGVTQQLLAFSRKQVLQPAVLNLNTLVLGLSNMLQRLLGEDVEMSVVPSARGKVRADATQLEQVIMNLAVNARDAMPNGGKLLIETGDVTLDREYSERHAVALPPGDYVMLAVTDSGSGMDEETRVRIFEPFFTTKERDKGTGLGLATVYGIVKQSEGFIWVYSEPGKGSTFKVYLPRVADPEDRQQGWTETEPPQRGSETILLVEDEQALRAVAADYLHSLGYTVLDASNGEEALSLIRSHPKVIELLVTDMVMPGMGGPQLAKMALELQPHLRIIYVSGYTDRALDRSVIGENAAFLQKPFNLSSLAVRIRELLENPNAS